ncbi:Small auxin-up RNA [Sesbania bispinosa]|nr:Small auxin-up RNA [Sesbania bispinosa]
MDGMNMMMKEKGNKKGLITKTWERCKSIGSSKSSKRSKSWPRRGKKKNKSTSSVVAPEGCFSVYVGPQMQRFVIKAEYANHPLFKMLLEEAESEYGYNSQGPLALPCNVDMFYKVLMEMDEEQDQEYITTTTTNPHQGCTSVLFGKRSRSSYHLLSPSRMLLINNF